MLPIGTTSIYHIPYQGFLKRPTEWDLATWKGIVDRGQTERKISESNDKAELYYRHDVRFFRQGRSSENVGAE